MRAEEQGDHAGGRPGPAARGPARAAGQRKGEQGCRRGRRGWTAGTGRWAARGTKQTGDRRSTPAMVELLPREIV